ncbi:MAG: N-6 DNA methylase [Chloroflexota bacterium]|nr:N-6 DNA methylase [Chloroflexota bacterium]
MRKDKGKNNNMISKELISRINKLLKEKGLARTWADILHTKVEKRGSEFSYILSNKFFTDSNSLNYDLLHKLSFGEISVLYEYSLSYINQEKRENKGQYFTPDDVSKFMSRSSNNFANGIWIDPCSGIGNLSYWLIKEQKDAEEFIINNLYLVDKDYLALTIGRVLFTLEFQNKENDLYNLMEKRFICMDFLEDNDFPNYDYAILNPPYVVTKPNLKFRSALTKNTYAFFLEKVINETKGFISITPQNFTNSSSYEVIRLMLLSKFSELKIFCFDNVPQNIFRGYKFGSKNTNRANSTRAAIIVANSEKKEKDHRITPLIRWRSTERKELFSQVEEFLAETPLSSKKFPKIDKGLVNLYKEVKNCPTILKDLVTQESTEYCLQVPLTPRYFISAIKDQVSRSSDKILFFVNKENYDLAYLLLNSSYMYWWWRINDGGMTLTKNTLLSLPIPEKINIDEKLIKELEKSEVENRVYKKNAGKLIGNVKHKKTLIYKLNNHLFPNYAKMLSYTHRNSIFAERELVINAPEKDRT